MNYVSRHTCAHTHTISLIHMRTDCRHHDLHPWILQQTHPAWPNAIIITKKFYMDSTVSSQIQSIFKISFYLNVPDHSFLRVCLSKSFPLLSLCYYNVLFWTKVWLPPCPFSMLICCRHPGSCFLSLTVLEMAEGGRRQFSLQIDPPPPFQLPSSGRFPGGQSTRMACGP